MMRQQIPPRRGWIDDMIAINGSPSDRKCRVVLIELRVRDLDSRISPESFRAQTMMNRGTSTSVAVGSFPDRFAMTMSQELHQCVLCVDVIAIANIAPWRLWASRDRDARNNQFTITIMSC